MRRKVTTTTGLRDFGEQWSTMGNLAFDHEIDRLLGKAHISKELNGSTLAPPREKS